MHSRPGPTWRRRSVNRSSLTSALRLCVAAMAIAACTKRGEEQPEPEPEPLSVRVQNLTRRSFDATITIDGALEVAPGNDVKLSPQTPGRLAELLVGEGETVKRGQLLARSDPRALAAPVREAEA